MGAPAWISAHKTLKTKTTWRPLVCALANAEYRAITAKAREARRHRNALPAQLEALTLKVRLIVSLRLERSWLHGAAWNPNASLRLRHIQNGPNREQSPDRQIWLTNRQHTGGELCKGDGEQHFVSFCLAMR